MMRRLIVCLFLILLLGVNAAPNIDRRKLEMKEMYIRKMKETLMMTEKLKAAMNATQGKPTIFVPGIGGSILQAKLNKTTSPSFFCYTKTSYYYKIWLSIEDLVPEAVNCFVDNMKLMWDEKENKWINRTGVDMVPLGGTDGCDYLDPSNQFTRYETYYFSVMTSAFVKAGYIKGQNLTALTYDWRLTPNQQDYYYSNMTETIESFYKNNNNTKVMLITHSMGCLMTLYYLNRMPQEWKDKYIDSWIPIAGPFSGAFVALKSILSGYNLGINLISNSVSMQFNRQQAASYWLFPTYQWGSDKVLVTTPKKNYTLSDMKQLFADANLTDLYKFYLLPRNLTDEIKTPNVKVFCIYGYNVSTDYGYVYGSTFTNPVAIPGDGDGTVPLFSATMCKNWSTQQKEPVEVMGVPNVLHMYLISDLKVINFVLTEAFNL